MNCLTANIVEVENPWPNYESPRNLYAKKIEANFDEKPHDFIKLDAN